MHLSAMAYTTHTHITITKIGQSIAKFQFQSSYLPIFDPHTTNTLPAKQI